MVGISFAVMKVNLHHPQVLSIRFALWTIGPFRQRGGRHTVSCLQSGCYCPQMKLRTPAEGTSRVWGTVEDIAFEEPSRVRQRAAPGQVACVFRIHGRRPRTRQARSTSRAGRGRAGLRARRSLRAILSAAYLAAPASLPYAWIWRSGSRSGRNHISSKKHHRIFSRHAYQRNGLPINLRTTMASICASLSLTALTPRGWNSSLS